MNTIVEVDPNITTGPWRIRNGVHYKNARDFMKQPKWVLIYWMGEKGELDCTILHSGEVRGPLATKHNVYETNSKANCINKAIELGIPVCEIC